MSPLNTLPHKAPSTRTTSKNFRITYTQDNLLKQRMGDKSSALVRVLLSLYFNKKLAPLKFQGVDIELLIEAEVKESKEALVQGSLKGIRRKKEIAQAKRNGTF